MVSGHMYCSGPVGMILRSSGIRKITKTQEAITDFLLRQSVDSLEVLTWVFNLDIDEEMSQINVSKAKYLNAFEYRKGKEYWFIREMLNPSNFSEDNTLVENLDNDLSLRFLRSEITKRNLYYAKEMLFKNWILQKRGYANPAQTVSSRHIEYAFKINSDYLFDTFIFGAIQSFFDTMYSTTLLAYDLEKNHDEQIYQEIQEHMSTFFIYLYCYIEDRINKKIPRVPYYTRNLFEDHDKMIYGWASVIYERWRHEERNKLPDGLIKRRSH